eukprot:TRINITY_DN2316_c0_g1_i1.p1 TRINITY_DN2316_c0_g1~~TRINITY_DN2316_c0_g1_i1.p1  ORF type:complete len:843 (-),score=149.69 TRINITY_DN2316_c0_g1_i1:79-2571(-)
MATARARSISYDSQELKGSDPKRSGQGLPRVSANAYAGDRQYQGQRSSGRGLQEGSTHRASKISDCRYDQDESRRSSKVNQNFHDRHSSDEDDDGHRPSPQKANSVRENGMGRTRRPSNMSTNTSHGYDDESDLHQPSGSMRKAHGQDRGCDADVARHSTVSRSANGHGRDDADDICEPPDRVRNTRRQSCGENGYVGVDRTRNSRGQDFDDGRDQDQPLNRTRNTNGRGFDDDDSLSGPSNGIRNSSGQCLGDEGDIRRPLNSNSARPQTLNRVRDDADDLGRQGTRNTNSQRHDDEGTRRPSAISAQKEDSEPETELFDERLGWRAMSQAYPNGIPDGETSCIGQVPKGGRTSHGNICSEEAHADRKPTERQSYSQRRDRDEDVQRVSNVRTCNGQNSCGEIDGKGRGYLSSPAKKSNGKVHDSEDDDDDDAHSAFGSGTYNGLDIKAQYSRGRDAENDASRASKFRNSCNQDQEGDIRRLSNGGRRSYGQIREKEEEVRRSSAGKRASHQADDHDDDDDDDDHNENAVRLAAENKTSHRGQVEDNMHRRSNGGRSSSRQIFDEDKEIERREPSNIVRSSRRHADADEDYDSEQNKVYCTGPDSRVGGRSHAQDESRHSLAGKKTYHRDHHAADDIRRASESRDQVQAEDKIRRQSNSRRESNRQFFDDDHEVETRRPSNSVRSSRASVDDEDARGRNVSRAAAPRGSEQRMLSRAPDKHASDKETEVYFEGPGWVRRSQAPSGTLTVRLAAQDERQMKSILWDFSGPCCRVKAVGAGCPESGRSLRPGDELFSINGNKVHKEPRKYVESKWSDAQDTDTLELVFFQK